MAEEEKKSGPPYGLIAFLVFVFIVLGGGYLFITNPKR
tara:strand:+ start:2050 stop:2163 length:114 start_codon:yes stop_codon:yes gene_type:complete